MKLFSLALFTVLSSSAFSGTVHEYRIDGVIDVANLRGTDGIVGHLLLVDNDSNKEIANIHFDCNGVQASNTITPCPITIQKTFRKDQDYANISIVVIDQGEHHFLWTYTRAEIGMLTASVDSPISSMILTKGEWATISSMRASTTSQIELTLPGGAGRSEQKMVSSVSDAYNVIRQYSGSTPASISLRMVR